MVGHMVGRMAGQLVGRMIGLWFAAINVGFVVALGCDYTQVKGANADRTDRPRGGAWLRAAAKRGSTKTLRSKPHRPANALAAPGCAWLRAEPSLANRAWKRAIHVGFVVALGCEYTRIKGANSDRPGGGWLHAAAKRENR